MGMSMADDRQQLLALMILDEHTGAKVAMRNNNWVVMLTGPRFQWQYIYTGRSVVDEIAIKADAGISDRIPRLDLMMYYVWGVDQWTINVMLDDYRNDALQVTL